MEESSLASHLFWWIPMLFGIYRQTPTGFIYEHDDDPNIKKHTNIPIHQDTENHIHFDITMLTNEGYRHAFNRGFYSYKTTLICILINLCLIFYLWTNDTFTSWIKYGDLEMQQSLFLNLWQRIILTFLLFWGNTSILVIRNPLRKKTIQQFLYRSLLMATFSLYCLNRDDLCNQLDTINNYPVENTIVTGDVNGKTNLRYLEYNSLLFDPFDDDNSNAFSNYNSNLLDKLSYNHVIRLDSNRTCSEVSLNGITYRINRNTFNLITNCNMNGTNVHIVVAKSNNSTLLTFTRGTERNIDLFKNICMEWYVSEKTRWFEDDMYRRLNIRDKLAVLSYGWHWAYDNNMQQNGSTMVINCDGASITVIFNPENKVVPSYNRVLRPRAGWIA